MTNSIMKIVVLGLCTALLATLASSCTATETGGGMGPPEAPMVMPREDAWAHLRLHDVVAIHQPCELEWETTGATAIAGPESIDRYEWLENGTLLSYERLNFAQGTRNRSLTQSYDEAGKLIQKDWDESGDGVYDLTYKHSYSPDLRLAEIQRYEGEDLQKTEAFSYDDAGRVSYVETFVSGESPTLRVSQLYDDSGNRVEQQFDYEVDGTIDSRFTYSFDSNSNLLSESRDFNDDGTVTEERSFSWDTSGNRINETDYYKGDETRELDYTYDQQGRLESVSYQNRGGSPDITWQAVAVYDCQ